MKVRRGCHDHLGQSLTVQRGELRLREGRDLSEASEALQVAVRPYTEISRPELS